MEKITVDDSEDGASGSNDPGIAHSCQFLTQEIGADVDKDAKETGQEYVPFVQGAFVRLGFQQENFVEGKKDQDGKEGAEKEEAHGRDRVEDEFDERPGKPPDCLGKKDSQSPFGGAVEIFKHGLMIRKVRTKG